MACVCPKGTFLNFGEDNCEDVVVGVNETVNGLTIETLLLLPGYWRQSSRTEDVRECLVTEACVGGEVASQYCLEGHRGPYCNVCEDGFSKDVFKLCQRCNSSNRNIVGTVLGFVGFVIGLFGAHFLKKKLEHIPWVRIFFKSVMSASRGYSL
jgi:hypothetical protein